MVTMKDILVYTNPITWIAGVAVLTGVIVASLTHNVVKDTA